MPLHWIMRLLPRSLHESVCWRPSCWPNLRDWHLHRDAGE